MITAKLFQYKLDSNATLASIHSMVSVIKPHTKLKHSLLLGVCPESENHGMIVFTSGSVLVRFSRSRVCLTSQPAPSESGWSRGAAAGVAGSDVVWRCLEKQNQSSYSWTVFIPSGWDCQAKSVYYLLVNCDFSLTFGRHTANLLFSR